jgi:hypothetical protein
MKSLFNITIIILTFFSFVSYNSPYWGPTGHRTVGKIASNHLTKKAENEIKKILNGQTIAWVSTYADEIKSDKNYNRFYSWHYVNFPIETGYENSQKNPKGDLITGINSCIAILKNKESSKQDKNFYLKMLIHLIGDLHQPFHVGNKKDKGGNDIQVRWFDKGTNLHHVWDIDMIEKWNMSYTELVCNIDIISKEKIKEYQKGSIIDWVYESKKLAENIYQSIEPGDKLSYKYSYLYFNTVTEQLEKGGVRLSKILNDIYN